MLGRVVGCSMCAVAIVTALACGPHRDGQLPAGAAPTLEEIRESDLDLQVMLGVWIGPEERLDAAGEVIEHDPTARAANEEQVNAEIRTASEYPEIVAAISEGNETRVTWSAHRSSLARLHAAVRDWSEADRSPKTVFTTMTQRVAAPQE